MIGNQTSTRGLDHLDAFASCALARSWSRCHHQFNSVCKYRQPEGKIKEYLELWFEQRTLSGLVVDKSPWARQSPRVIKTNNGSQRHTHQNLTYLFDQCFHLILTFVVIRCFTVGKGPRFSIYREPVSKVLFAVFHAQVGGSLRVQSSEIILEGHIGIRVQ